MYISGNITDFSSRLHQLPEATGDLNSFVIEGNSYSSLTDIQETEKWNLEYSRKNDTFTSTGRYIEGFPF